MIFSGDSVVRRPLVCLPFAGGGAGIYAGLRTALAGELHVQPVQLPGRETRFGETPLSTWDDVDAFLSAEVLPRLTPRTVLYGHSMGALVGHRLCLLAESAGLEVAGLCAAAHRGPDTVEKFGVADMSDQDLLELLVDMTGNPLLEDLPQDLLADVVLPPVRADLHLCETYRPDPSELLRVPVLALTGTRDGAVGSAHGWAAWTEGPFTAREVDGDHFFVRDNPAAVGSAVSAWIGGLHARRGVVR